MRAASLQENGAVRERVVAASVVITTYRRVDQLRACLDGIRSQRRRADDVVVVVHASDDPSARLVERFAAEWPELRSVRVERYGSVAALNTGLAAARGEVVAIIDDDAIPRTDWLERIVKTFEQDQRIAAVGGRDVIIVDGRALGPPPSRIPGRRAHPPEVGRMQWFGRMIANHHLGAGEPRDVDVLKGVNCSFRRAAVAGHGYDERLCGGGAVVHTEMSICLPLRRRGLRIVYDPNIVVQHYPAPRPAGDHRIGPSRMAVFATAHNEALQILDYFGPLRRVVFGIWGLLVGTTDGPGLAVLARDALTGRPAAWSRFRAAQRGRAAAWRTRRVPRGTPSALSSNAASPRPAQESDNRKLPARPGGATPAVSVVVPTYRRVERLAACLEGVRSQTLPASEVLVVTHISDGPTAGLMARLTKAWPELRSVRLDRHGLLAALNGGLATARGEVVAFVDDDAVPSVDWLERIVATFAQAERIAAVGGRDVIVEDGRVIGAPGAPHRGRPARSPEVGRLQWFGRMIANHHLGVGEARDVDVLKGVNCSFRRAAVLGHGFDERLRGYGVEVHSELSICLPLRRRGMRIVYDPAIVVMHYPAPRSLGEQRGDTSPEAVFAASHNETLEILDHFGTLQRAVFASWGLLIGTTEAPGVAVLARDALAGRAVSWSRFRAAQRGRATAWRTRRVARPIPAHVRDGGAERPRPESSQRLALAAAETEAWQPDP